MIYSDKKFAAFAFNDSVPEENRSWKSPQLGKKKSRYADSDVDKYNLLESFAGGVASRRKKPMNETSSAQEVNEATTERIYRSDAALQSSSSNYNLNSLSQSKFPDSHKASTNRKDSDSNQGLHLTDNDVISIISDEDIDNSSTMSSSYFADAEEQILENEINSHNKEPSVVVCPDYVTYGSSCYSKAQLTFFCSSIKLDVSEKGATGCLTFEWKTSNIISIQSQWLEPSIRAEVCLLVKSEHGQKSGILEVKFTFTDSCWSDTQDLIKSLNEQYKEKWVVDLESCELFEDITYLEGDGDCITISKRDFQLLQPEKFINDTIVDFYIEYLKKIKSADAKVHFFNSFFFRKLADFDENQSRSVDSKEAFQRVRKWTKKVNIFQNDYIFIPVNFRLHWSLIIICHPGEAVNFRDDELEKSPKVPCILHMDSIKGSHRGLENCIKSYLWEEWKERNNDTSDNISTKFTNLRFLRLEVPQQENSYDCGLFMLHYMELFVKQASDSFNPLNNFIDKDWFHPLEASLKRVRIKRLIFELTKSNTQPFLSPKSSFELKDEDDEEEEEADLQILDETSNTCVNESRDDTPLIVKPSRSEDTEINHLDSESNGGSLNDNNEQNNRGQIVLYDPSIKDMSSTKLLKQESDKTEDFGEKQIVEVSKPDKINPIVSCINESMNLLQLKEKSTEDNNPFASLVVEDSDDNVIEVEDSDSDSDDDSGNYQRASSSSLCVFKDVAKFGSILETSKRKLKRPVFFVGRKRRRRSD